MVASKFSGVLNKMAKFESLALPISEMPHSIFTKHIFT